VLGVAAPRGLFVQALVAKEIDATGIDIAEHAI
jgi:hypothetical protein